MASLLTRLFRRKPCLEAIHGVRHPAHEHLEWKQFVLDMPGTPIEEYTGSTRHWCKGVQQ